MATSDAITGSTLSCMSTELESGPFVLLGTESWLHMEYGFVSLKNHPRTHAAATFMEFVLDAERMVVEDEQRLVARFRPG